MYLGFYLYGFAAQFNDSAFSDASGFTTLGLAALITAVLIGSMFLFGAICLLVSSFAVIFGGASLKTTFGIAGFVLLAIAIVTVLLNAF